MSRIFGLLYAIGVFVFVAGGIATVATLTTGHSETTMPIRLCMIGAALLIPEALRKWKLFRERRLEEARLRAEAAAQRKSQMEAAEQVRRNAAQSAFDLFVGEAEPLVFPRLHADARRIALQPGEDCCALTEAAEHVTTRKHAPVSREKRPALQLKRGVRYQISGDRGNPLADVSERVTDRGALYVTNRRIVFDGARETLNVPLEKILQVHLDGDRIILLVQHQLHPVIFHVSERYQAPVIAAASFRMSERFRGDREQEATASGPTEPAEGQHKGQQAPAAQDQ